MKNKIEAIFVGTSAGGVTALQNLFLSMGPKFDLPVIIVQHLPADATIIPDLVFGSKTNMKVIEAGDKMQIQNGYAYFAPAGYHLLVEKDHTLALSQDEMVHYSRPSIDVLFESAAEVYGQAACGVLMTGANSDGAAGLKVIHDSGGYTMVQDPKEAEATAMPLAALSLFDPNYIGSIKGIGETISQLKRVEDE